MDENFSIRFTCCRHLKNCSIAELPENVFRNQKYLRRLYLNFNALSNIKNGSFNGDLHLILKAEKRKILIYFNFFLLGLHSTEWLFLDYNRINYIQLDDLQHLSSLKFLNLSHNFISFAAHQRFPNLPNILELWVHLFSWFMLICRSRNWIF